VLARGLVFEADGLDAVVVAEETGGGAEGPGALAGGAGLEAAGAGHGLPLVRRGRAVAHQASLNVGEDHGGSPAAGEVAPFIVVVVGGGLGQGGRREEGRKGGLSTGSRG
jgi:hypothetical protein